MVDSVDLNEKLASEYNSARDEFDFGFVLVGLFLVLAIFYASGIIGGDSKNGI